MTNPMGLGLIDDAREPDLLFGLTYGMDVVSLDVALSRDMVRQTIAMFAIGNDGKVVTQLIPICSRQIADLFDVIPGCVVPIEINGDPVDAEADGFVTLPRNLTVEFSGVTIREQAERMALHLRSSSRADPGRLMSPLEMIEEWRKGCSIAGPACGQNDSPAECHECTEGLIDALEDALKRPGPIMIEWADDATQTLHRAPIADWPLWLRHMTGVDEDTTVPRVIVSATLADAFIRDCANPADVPRHKGILDMTIVDHRFDHDLTVRINGVTYRAER